MKKVYVHSSLEIAYLTRDLLNANGIASAVFNEHAAMTPAVPGGTALVPAEVWIHDDELYDQARRVIMDARKAHRQQSQEAESSQWVCSACEEDNPSTFEICWQCQKHR